LSAGAKAKSVTNNLPILSVLAVGFFYQYKAEVHKIDGQYFTFFSISYLKSSFPSLYIIVSLLYSEGTPKAFLQV
jgi:hypothetical protein